MTYLIKSNHLLLIKKKTRTTKKIFDVAVDKDKIEAKTFLQQMLTLLSRKKIRTSFISNAFSVKKKTINLVNVLKKRS